MNVAVVDWDHCYPANSGKRLRTLNLLLELAQRHDVAFLSRASGETVAGREARDFLAGRGIAGRFFDLPVPTKSGLSFYGRLARNLAASDPYVVEVHRSVAFRRALHDYAARHRVDVWQAEWSPYAEMVRDAPGGAPVVLMAHNVDTLVWERYCETETRPWVRPYLRLQCGRFRRYERRAFQAADRVVAVSDADARLMREQFGIARAEVVENGVDMRYFQPAGGGERDPREMLFLGSLDWRPNVDGVKFFLAEVMPRVLRQQPQAQLTVVGRNPSPALARLIAESPGCALLADVPDVRPYLARAGMMVVPLRIGGGSRLKILEAAASRLPVVSTTVGAEGLHLEAGRDLALADAPAAQATAITHWMESPGEAARCAENARQVAAASYDWPKLADRLERIWEDAARTASAPAGAC